VLLLTSPQPLAGQAAVAANLAAVFSQSGRKVLLVDANLRRPDVHKQLDLHNRLGLSDVMRELEAPLDEFLQAYRGENGVAFSVLPSGSLPPNPMEILSSTRMGQLLQAWLADFEVVIVNAPALGVPDAQVLATHADGVLLLGEVGRTRVGAVQAAIEKLLSSRARVLGVVLDQVNEQPRDYYRRR
jgi:capsular exopolysaccharide synthesis family protein